MLLLGKKETPTRPYPNYFWPLPFPQDFRPGSWMVEWLQIASVYSWVFVTLNSNWVYDSKITNPSNLNWNVFEKNLTPLNLNSNNIWEHLILQTISQLWRKTFFATLNLISKPNRYTFKYIWLPFFLLISLFLFYFLLAFLIVHKPLGWNSSPSTTRLTFLSIWQAYANYDFWGFQSFLIAKQINYTCHIIWGASTTCQKAAC